MLEQSVHEGLCPTERTCAAVVHEERQLMGRTHKGEVYGELSPVRGIPHCSRGRE